MVLKTAVLGGKCPASKFMVLVQLWVVLESNDTCPSCAADILEISTPLMWMPAGVELWWGMVETIFSNIGVPLCTLWSRSGNWAQWIEQHSPGEELLDNFLTWNVCHIHYTYSLIQVMNFLNTDYPQCENTSMDIYHVWVPGTSMMPANVNWSLSCQP